MTNPTPAELRTIASEIAREAGALAARRRAEGVEIAASKSSPVDIVTHTDREVEALIRRRLEELRPGDGFLGEESSAGGPSPSATGLTWVVDPIDGTVNFVYGHPTYTVSIAVVEGDPDPLTWRALASCVYNPSTGEEFAAARGEGATLTLHHAAPGAGAGPHPLHPSSPPDLSQSLLATGFSYDQARRAEQGALVGPLVSRVRDIRRIGTASLDLCYVAAGRLDAYVERGLQPWDLAGGVLVAEEAGAVVLTPEGAQASSALSFVAAPSIAVELGEALREIGW
ncbi:inositol monophosphatase family protein [Frondihabitans australicus]|uniref:Inositol-1-monophosphatase n=1 Tax=Frondihabitans australicus TaxID=386892 RepID=A0A495IAP1_9MICO|nr:inositol monophosphatase family protein [Frondihabitans australicus]RKR73074.1 myo-inositol-1(or 4)-monophosphatase [Frondihabitans australicus]